MPVAVEGDRDCGGAQVGAQSLGIEVSGDPDAGERVATLVEAERFEARPFPARVCATAEDAGIRRPFGVVGARKEQPVAWVVEEDLWPR